VKILAISPWVPRPDQTSGDRRFFALLEMMATSHEVDLAVIADDVTDASRQYRGRCEEIGVRVLLPSANGVEPSLRARVYDAFFCEYWHAAEAVIPILRGTQPWAHVVTDSVDVHFLREEAWAAAGGINAATVRENRQREMAAYEKSDVVVVVTEEDSRALQSAGYEGPIVLLPNVVPVRPRPSMKRNNDLLFVGGFRHAPNVNGLLWFIREIFPLVRLQIPDARLRVVGSEATAEITALASTPGIEVLGFVPDTGPCLDQAAVSVAPLLFGAGMKGKVCEAMAAGLPVVATTIGCQGLNVASGDHCLVADEGPVFAENVVRLLANPELGEQIGRRGQLHIAGICGAEAVRKQLVELLDSIGGKLRRSSTQLFCWRLGSAVYFPKMIVKSALMTLGARRLIRFLRAGSHQEPIYKDPERGRQGAASTEV
jgi:O-antigen biosynthesis protein